MDEGTKEYKPGDQLHISVTKDFSETATEFFRFCRRRNFNASQVIRSAISAWLERQKQIYRMADERLGPEEGIMDEMLASYEKSVLYEK